MLVIVLAANNALSFVPMMCPFQKDWKLLTKPCSEYFFLFRPAKVGLTQKLFLYQAEVSDHHRYDSWFGVRYIQTTGEQLSRRCFIGSDIKRCDWCGRGHPGPDHLSGIKCKSGGYEPVFRRQIPAPYRPVLVSVGQNSELKDNKKAILSIQIVCHVFESQFVELFSCRLSGFPVPVAHRVEFF